MSDVNLRIKALAAYRWAEQPNFDNLDEVQLWLDHLGDWGLEYDEYVVKSGDTLAGLAARVYGEQHRWHAIQTYKEKLASELLRSPFYQTEYSLQAHV